MDDCCTGKACTVDALRDRQAGTLKLVLWVNAAMFVVELVAGLLAGSVSLLADSLDMLGDALVYGFSLYVVGRDDLWKARAAAVKAGVMALFGLFVLAQLVYKIVHPAPPVFETMGAIALLALAANSLCFAVLWRHRADDINMRSVWMCSRNDLIANTSVLGATLAVWATASQWPDIVVGAAICVLFLRSAFVVAREARTALRAPSAPSPSAARVTVSPSAPRRKSWTTLS